MPRPDQAGAAPAVCVCARPNSSTSSISSELSSLLSLYLCMRLYFSEPCLLGAPSLPPFASFAFDLPVSVSSEAPRSFVASWHETGKTTAWFCPFWQ